MTSYTRCFAWSGNPWRTKEKWTREGKYINGGCLSKRHVQAAYQKQNRSREPPRSLISTHASFLHTYYKCLFIVNIESWWKRISLPPFIIFVDIVRDTKTFTPKDSRTSFASSLDDNTSASALFHVQLFRDKWYSQTSVDLHGEIIDVTFDSMDNF